MNKPIIVAEHNIETDEYIIRDMTDKEIEQRKKDELESELKMQQFADAAAKKAAAESKLAALGLDANDLKALGLQNNLERL